MPEARQPEIYKSTQKAGNRGIFPVGEPGGNTVHGSPAGDGLSLRTFSIYGLKSC